MTTALVSVLITTSLHDFHKQLRCETCFAEPGSETEAQMRLADEIAQLVEQRVR